LSNRRSIDVLTRELARHSVDRWHIDRQHHHPRLVFERDGKQAFYVLSSSGSDWRGSLQQTAG